MTSFKYIIAGDRHVGKTTLMAKYAENCPSFDNMGIEYRAKFVTIGDNSMKIQIFSEAEMDLSRFQRCHYRTSFCVFFVFDLNLQSSFIHTKFYLEKCFVYSDKSLPVLIGNKCDLEHAVSDEDIKELVDKLNIKYFEVSAKDGTNVKEAFDYINEKANEKINQKLNEKVNQNNEKKKCIIY